MLKWDHSEPLDCNESCPTGPFSCKAYRDVRGEDEICSYTSIN